MSFGTLASLAMAAAKRSCHNQVSNSAGDVTHGDVYQCSSDISLNSFGIHD
jgi:hypothetical protein